MSEHKEETPKEETPEEEVTVKRSDYERLQNLEEDKNSLVSEIKELRANKQQTEAEKQELTDKLKELQSKEEQLEEVTPDRIQSIIDQQLDERLNKQEQKSREESRLAAIERFKSTHKELLDENDEAGLKMSALEKELAQFNTSSAKTVEDFTNFLNKAYTFVKKEEKPSDSKINQFAGDPAEGKREIPSESEEDKELTLEEKKIIDRSFGGDKERFLEQKKKRPDYVAQLINVARQYNY